ncbi:uncharacterized protein MAM_08138 [Metarhizium album ARSEF 1941]|uniref:Uncharacterized protein n=1 Tax=Metarhizium album (strain ARSEF 1941) TaxID=1081103 RepID=A0A0B2WJX5_METAS|nr:uncharacterized protein MAM_08138 [Metarhizium album ARSEF 1941]KHN94009.1 hypothetical protein MAM_08138 [Metarhizium album ARSEF 1941]
MGVPWPAPAANSVASCMPAPPPMPMLNAQHERLILELLPFKDAARFKEWLNSALVQGSWAEFWRDLVTQQKTRHMGPEPDKTKTAEAAKNAVSGRILKFLAYHPDKTNWTADDHHVRFIVTVVQDNMLNGLWSDADWKKRATEVCRAVYEVLCYLKASYYSVEMGRPPSYSQ